jgi:excisionase family DNA binding protein
MNTTVSPPPPRLLSIRDTAMMLSLSQRTVWKLIAIGELPQPLRIGGARRFRVEDVENYIAKLAEAR